MNERSINWTRRIVTFLLTISLIGDILLWLAFHATAHKIPINTELSFATMTIILVGLIFVTRKYIRNKPDNDDRQEIFK